MVQILVKCLVSLETLNVEPLECVPPECKLSYSIELDHFPHSTVLEVQVGTRLGEGLTHACILACMRHYQSNCTDRVNSSRSASKLVSTSCIPITYARPSLNFPYVPPQLRVLSREWSN